MKVGDKVKILSLHDLLRISPKLLGKWGEVIKIDKDDSTAYVRIEDENWWVFISTVATEQELKERQIKLIERLNTLIQELKQKDKMWIAVSVIKDRLKNTDLPEGLSQEEIKKLNKIVKEVNAKI